MEIVKLMQTKVRNSNIEFLRIFSMFLIVAYHAATNSILYDNDVLILGSFINKISIASLYPCGRIGVMLFFMITGFFLADKTTRNCNKIIIKTCFYSFITVLTFFIIKYIIKCPIQSYGGGRTLLQFFFPVSSGVIWFTTSYLFILAVLPIINGFLNKLTFKGFIILLCFLDFIPFGIGNILNVPYVRLYEALFFYSTGVFYNKYMIGKNINKVVIIFLSLLIYLGAIILSFEYIDMLISQNRFAFCIPFFIDTLIVPLICMGIFTITINKKMVENKFINLISGSTLAVYLLHGSVFQKYIWEQLFNVKEVYLNNYFPLKILVISFIVFVSCILIDLFCNKFIFPFINKKIIRIAERLKNICIKS